MTLRVISLVALEHDFHLFVFVPVLVPVFIIVNNHLMAHILS